MGQNLLIDTASHWHTDESIIKFYDVHYKTQSDSGLKLAVVNISIHCAGQPNHTANEKKTLGYWMSKR